VSATIDQERLEQFSSLEFYARQVVEGFITGLHKSPFHGFSVEFAEHRLYNTGESIRNIDWKLFGRTNRLYVKRYEEETNLRCQILLDISSSMYYPLITQPTIERPNKITFAVHMAAALIYLFRKQRDAVGISAFSGDVEWHTPCKSTVVHHKYLLSGLAKYLEPIGSDNRKPTMAATSIHEIAERLHKRSLVIIFSDMFELSGSEDELFSSLQHLRHNKHEVILFHVIDKSKELDFDFGNRPTRFIDMETGAQVRAVPSQIRERYTDSVTHFMEELKLKCGQYRIDFIPVDIHAGFEQVLLPYLVKRSRLF